MMISKLQHTDDLEEIGRNFASPYEDRTDCYYHSACSEECSDCAYYDSVFGKDIDEDIRRDEFLVEFFEYTSEVEPEFD